MKTNITYDEMRKKLGYEPNSFQELPKHHNVPGYKQMYLDKEKNNRILLGFCIVTTVGAVLFNLGAIKRNRLLVEALEQQQDQTAIGLKMSVNYDEYTKSLEKQLENPIVFRSNEDIIRFVFGDKSKEAIKIAKCESSLRSDATNKNTNGSKDVGLFQINSVHGIKESYLKNPLTNTLIAKQIYTEQGWNPWTCKKAL